MTDFMKTLQREFPSSLRGERILLAVSGGADSVAMLRAMQSLREQYGWQLRVAHLNHGLRGESADADERWLADLCRRLSLPLTVGHFDVTTTAKESGQGLEEAARDIRYRFLHDAAREHASPFVAVAHTADDQVETILHHILRGSGLDGLRGMPKCRPLSPRSQPAESDGVAHPTTMLVRPLLTCTRQEVEGYLTEIHQDYRCDESNADQQFTRNKIRLELLPQLRREYHPRISEVLLTLSRQAGEIAETIDQLAEELLQQCLEESAPAVCCLNCEKLSHRPRHLIRACLTLLWKRLDWPRQRMGYNDWNRLAELILTAGALSLPGRIEARRQGAMLVLRRTDA